MTVELDLKVQSCSILKFIKSVQRVLYPILILKLSRDFSYTQTRKASRVLFYDKIWLLLLPPAYILWMKIQ